MFSFYTVSLSFLLPCYFQIHICYVFLGQAHGNHKAQGLDEIEDGSTVPIWNLVVWVAHDISRCVKTKVFDYLLHSFQGLR